MIDARDDVGTPVITDCPNFVTFGEETYLIDADAFRIKLGPITFEPEAGESLFDHLRRFTI